jgi:phosphatidylserine decarboxylase
MKTLLKYFVELTGNPTSSRILKSFAQSRLSKPLVKPFAHAYGINQDEMEYPIDHYQSLNDFFTRRLKADSRTTDLSANVLVSPVDGILSDCGYIHENRTFRIKGHTYMLDEILGSDKKAAFYNGGFFYVFYLSPAHYHHFHYPIDGSLVSRYALGEKSYPVNDLGLRFGDRPFATNYRIISELSTTYGKVAMVKVGALNINSIVLANSNEEFTKGEELGYFTFGSTVILFVEKNNAFQPLCHIDNPVFAGQAVGKWII